MAITQRSTLKDSLETLDLELNRYQPSDPTFRPREDAQEPNPLCTTASGEPLRDSPHQAWIDALNEDLAWLAVVVQQSRRLGTLRVRLGDHYPLGPSEGPTIIFRYRRYEPYSRWRI